MPDILNEDDLPLMVIAENLRRLRLQNKLTPAKVAKVINISRQGYMNYEAAKREVKIASLIILSNFYNVSIDSIVGNTNANGVESKLNYQTFELKAQGIMKTVPTIISNQYNDTIMVKISDTLVKFFWRTDTYAENREMLFEYKSQFFISKIWFKSDGSGYFYSDNIPTFFTRKDNEEFIYLGILSSVLTKQLNIKNTF